MYSFCECCCSTKRSRRSLQIIAQARSLAGLTETLLMGEGILAAVDSLGALDFALLGSSSLVTGAVAAIGAALTRPDMVKSMANLIATLQTLWLVFPAVRRHEQDEPSAISQVRPLPTLVPAE